MLRKLANDRLIRAERRQRRWKALGVVNTGLDGRVAGGYFALLVTNDCSETLA